MSIIVYDLDDTLRDVSCAVDLIPDDKSKQENWTDWQLHTKRYGYRIDCVADKYHADLRRSPKCLIYIVTNSSFGTRDWLTDRGMRIPDSIVERQKGDNRHPVQYKKDWLIRNAHDVVKWVDDNQDVCDYIRSTYPHIEVVQVIKVPSIGYTTITDSVPSIPQQLELEFNKPNKEMLDRTQPNKVVIFNGPPRSGKDLATEFCCEYFNGTHASMKAPLLKLTADSLDVSVEEFLHNYDEECVDADRETWDCVWVKDLPMYLVNAELISKRQALIHVSENIIKPTFGDAAFGKLAAETLPEGAVFFSDGGFPDEVQPIADKVGIENIMIVHIKREGYTFEGDSRDYVNIDGAKTVVVENTTLGKYLADVAEVVSLHLKAH